MLRPGQDVVALAEAAVADGVQLIGMAGGDGSLALVAAVAARHHVPMVVVPAGTRNHLAMDLGLDRGDVAGALDAYGAAVERAVNLGEVNGRPFVNTVSLGLYAEIIRSPAYREAKIDTTSVRCPTSWGPAAGRSTSGSPARPRNGTPAPTSYRSPTTPTAARCARSPAAPVSTGGSARPGVPRRGHDRPSRPAERVRRLGGADLRGGLRRSRRRRHRRRGAAISPPLRFTIRPGALRIRLPRHASGLSPAARVHSSRAPRRGLPGRRRAAVRREP